MAKASKPTPTGAYAVGRGKPPTHTRFKPGQSGNPGGRKKGSLNINTVLRSVLAKEVEVSENGRTERLALLEALILRQAQEGLRGSNKAIESLLDRFERMGGEVSDVSRELTEEDLTIIESAVTRRRNQRSSE